MGLVQLLTPIPAESVSVGGLLASLLLTGFPCLLSSLNRCGLVTSQAARPWSLRVYMLLNHGSFTGSSFNGKQPALSCPCQAKQVGD